MEAFYTFLESFPTRQVDKGEVILQQDEEPETAYVIKSGIVKTYNLTIGGEEKPITFNKEYELFPIGWVFLKQEQAEYYYEALTDCELYLVPRYEYVAFLHAHPQMLYRVIQDFAERYVGNQLRVNALIQSKASEKVLNTLHYLTSRFGRDVEADRIAIELPLTQQAMANFMGVARETAAIELKKLERDAVIAYHSRTYTVDMRKLKTLLDETETPLAEHLEMDFVPLFAADTVS